MALDEQCGKPEVGCEGGQLLLRRDLRAAADRVQEPVLLRGVADQQLHRAARSGRQCLQRVGGQEEAVGDRAVDRRVVVALPRSGVLCVPLADPVRRGHEGLGRGGEQPRPSGGHPGRRRDLGGRAGRVLHRGEGVDGTVQDGAAEEAPRPVGHRQAGHGGGARRLSGQGDPVGRAAERGDVVANPFQGGYLVEETPVVGEGRGAGVGVEHGQVTVGVGHMAEPLEAEAAVEGDDDEPSARQCGAVEVGLGR